MHGRTSEAAAHTQPRRVQDELLTERARKQFYLKGVRLDAAVGTRPRDHLGAQHALAQLGLGRKGDEVLTDRRGVAATRSEARLALAPAGGVVEPVQL